MFNGSVPKKHFNAVGRHRKLRGHLDPVSDHLTQPYNSTSITFGTYKT